VEARKWQGREMASLVLWIGAKVTTEPQKKDECRKNDRIPGGGMAR